MALYCSLKSLVQGLFVGTLYICDTKEIISCLTMSSLRKLDFQIFEYIRSMRQYISSLRRILHCVSMFTLNAARIEESKRKEEERKKKDEEWKYKRREADKNRVQGQ